MYKEYLPPRELKDYVKCFWILEHDYSKEPMQNGERIWPDGHFEMIFTYGNPYQQIENESTSLVSENFLIGQFSKELLLTSKGRTGLFGVRFHAWGLYPLINHSMRVFANRLTDLNGIFQDDVSQIRDSLLIDDRDVSIKNLSDFVFSKISIVSKEGEIIKGIAEEVYAKHGVVRIKDLMDKYEMSQRKIQKLFIEHVGIPAKQFAKIVRFNEAKKFIERNPEINLAELTYACGYSDQSHFIKNFKDLFGIRPSQHKERVNELIAFFNKKKSP